MADRRVKIVYQDFTEAMKTTIALHVSLGFLRQKNPKPFAKIVMRVNMLKIKWHTIVTLVLKVSINREKGNLCVYPAIQEPMLKKKTR